MCCCLELRDVLGVLWIAAGLLLPCHLLPLLSSSDRSQPESRGVPAAFAGSMFSAKWKGEPMQSAARCLGFTHHHMPSILFAPALSESTVTLFPNSPNSPQQPLGD